MFFLQSEFSCVLQAFHFDQNSFHTVGRRKGFLQSEFLCNLRFSF